MNYINVYDFDVADMLREILLDELAEMEAVKFE